MPARAESKAGSPYGHGREAVHAASQDDDDETFVDRGCGEHEARQRGDRDAEAGAFQYGATVDEWHGHLRMNSGDVSSNATACAGLSARPIAVRVSADSVVPNTASA